MEFEFCFAGDATCRCTVPHCLGAMSPRSCAAVLVPGTDDIVRLPSNGKIIAQNPKTLQAELFLGMYGSFTL